MTKSEDVANAFNSFFANIGSDLAAKLPPGLNDPMEYLQGNYPNSMQVPEVTMQEVIKVVKSLKNKKCHINDYAPFVIKEIVHPLSHPLSYLFNQSVSTNNSLSN